MHLNGELELDGLTGLALRDDDGKVVKMESTKRIKDLEESYIPFPARDLLPMESYIKAQESHGPSSGRWTSMLSSRGCPYGCTFCKSRGPNGLPGQLKTLSMKSNIALKSMG